MTIFLQAVFVKSSASVKQCPPDRLPEFALIGRSNVGKSSLINTLTESPGLAKVSKEPGESPGLAKVSKEPGDEMIQGLNDAKMNTRCLFATMAK